MLRPALRRAPPSLLPLAVAPLLAGCPLLQIEARVPEVCIARRDLAVTASAGQRELVVSVVLDDLAALRDLLDSDDELRFTRFAARAVRGVSSFDFVNSASITVLGAGDAALPPLLAFSCQDSCAQPDGALALAAASDDNAVAYLRASQLTVQVALRGAPPTREWAMDAEVCLAGEVTRTVGP